VAGAAFLVIGATHMGQHKSNCLMKLISPVAAIMPAGTNMAYSAALTIGESDPKKKKKKAQEAKKHHQHGHEAKCQGKKAAV
jgi:hypothetical protein